MQGSLFQEDEGETVKIVRKRLVCPRCGSLTKVYEVAEDARGVKKLCGACQRISDQGIADEKDAVKTQRKSREQVFPAVSRPNGPVIAWECRETFSLAVESTKHCPLLVGVVVVLVPSEIRGPRIVQGAWVE